MIKKGTISRECLKKYWNQFPNSACGYCPPDGALMTENSKNRKTYFAPDGETEEMFLDRMKRSKKEGRNLFFEEWEEKKQGGAEDWI